MLLGYWEGLGGEGKGVRKGNGFVHFVVVGKKMNKCSVSSSQSHFPLCEITHCLFRPKIFFWLGTVFLKIPGPRLVCSKS